MAMASVACSLSRRFVLKNTGVFTRYTGVKCTGTKGLILFRNEVTTTSGAILPKPVKTSFGLTRMTIVVIPFLYVGTLISKNFAALLEEHDIFVPEDDDDDD
ncbi:single-pass membrane protein with aspartate-rich tail 1b [Conger conger]|uniref:single-pass membrane protein with aspartate-rich tail 1b n=1 Tax=Conger conger TaxID=82655 RepID=UPI002A5A5979|nr:single-pass membrane protein with aspartate-rich tail 1b [Conger conger]